MAGRRIGGLWYFTFKKTGFDAERAEQRARSLRDIGADSVRVWVPWSEVERSSGQWDFSAVAALLGAAVRSGLRLDVTLCTCMAPAWYIAAHPDVWPVSHLGAQAPTSTNRVQGTLPSYWDRECRRITERFIEKTFRLCLHDLAPHVDFARISMGKLNEPTFPTKHAWWHRVRDPVGLGLRGEPADPGAPDHGRAERRAFIDRYLHRKGFLEWAIRRLNRRLAPHQRQIVFLAGSGDVEDPFGPFASHVDRYVEAGLAHP
ncbi:MAG: beta-galactosidase, partial [Thermoanaerobaculia bacterium]|nr:beta-galactosidase [Thermoanaerobaculia bacterium]